MSKGKKEVRLTYFTVSFSAVLTRYDYWNILHYRFPFKVK